MLECQFGPIVGTFSFLKRENFRGETCNAQLIIYGAHTDISIGVSI